MNLPSRPFLGLLLVFLGKIPVTGQTLIYDEALSGDIAGDQSAPTLVGSLAAGVNTIQGTDSFATDTVPPQGDTFSLNLGPNQVITSLQLVVTNFTGSATAYATFFQAQPFFGYEQLAVSGSGTYTFANPGVLAPGVYGLSTQFGTYDAAAGFNWRWDVQVAAIPEAPVWALLTTGLLLAVRRRLSGRHAAAHAYDTSRR